MSNTINLLNGLEFLYPDNNVISQIKRTLVKFPETEHILVDAFSLGQLKSKMWLIEHLPDHIGTVFICAGWYGTLASMMFDQIPEKITKIRSFDIDETCAPVADHMNKIQVSEGWRFKAITSDIMDINYSEHSWQCWSNANNRMSRTITDNPTTIINTSCEHIADFDYWYSLLPPGKLIVLQSNNFFKIEEHVNCSNDVNEFDAATPMSTTLFLGEKELPKYTRFMKIGYK